MARGSSWSASVERRRARPMRLEKAVPLLAAEPGLTHVDWRAGRRLTASRAGVLALYAARMLDLRRDRRLEGAPLALTAPCRISEESHGFARHSGRCLRPCHLRGTGDLARRKILPGPLPPLPGGPDAGRQPDHRRRAGRADRGRLPRAGARGDCRIRRRRTGRTRRRSTASWTASTMSPIDATGHRRLGRAEGR